MRYSRLRFRSSIFFGLTTLSIFFLLTLHILSWSTTELEQPETPQKYPQPPDGIPFWSALDQQNVFNLQAKQSQQQQLSNYSSAITSQRIDELFELIRKAHNDRVDSSDFLARFPQDPKWNFQKFVVQKLHLNYNDTNLRGDTADSAGGKGAHNRLGTDTGLADKNMNDNDKMQLRYFIRQVLSQWKKQHMSDRTITLADIMNEALVQDEPARLNTTWYQYVKTVTNLRTYDPYNPTLNKLLKILRYGKISGTNEMPQGTQIKLVLDLPGGFQGLLKPYRVPRNYQTQPDHFYFTDVERHHAEIAAFHVDRILGFNRVPPLVGRFLNITSDLRETATDALAKTFFTSPANNTCFRGHCSYYCDTSHAICGKPGDLLEASVQVLLPRPPEISWQKLTHPYRRSYSSNKHVEWESNEDYCYGHVLIDEDFHNRLLLDMMDLAAFDFLIGNMDRHHMMRISSFGINTALVHLDNGRAFGRYDTDDLSILSPIRQCCFFRYTTFSRLYRVYRDGFSKLVAESLKKGEILETILVDEYLIALDRRLQILFATIDTCIKTYTAAGVMIDDGIY